MSNKGGRFLRFFFVICVLTGFGGGTAWAAGPWFVSTSGNDGNDCLSVGTPCLTIGGAIGKASSGDTINVAAGTYAEQVVIDSKSLTLIGSGAGTTTIQAPAVLTNDPDGAKTVVLFTGPITAAISGFTIQGPVNGLNFGIYVRNGATANIHDNTVKNIRDAPLSGNQSGYGIEIGKYNNTFPFVNQVGHATITNNTVFGYQKTGIACEGAGSSATITGNTVTGAGLIPTTAQNGIQIRRGATGSINTNTVTGNAWTGHANNAAGIIVTYPGTGVIIQGNTVNHNTSNIYTYQADGVQILNNQVTDQTDGRVMAGITADSDDVATASVGITVTITGNTVKNNLSGGSHQGPGIFLWGVKSGTVSGNEIAGNGDDGILIGASGNIAITNNLFSGNGNDPYPGEATSPSSVVGPDPNAAAIDFGGVIPELESFGPQPNLLGGFAVHNNSFVGNRNGIWNYDVGSVDATCNWWGAANGPGPVGPGSGDPVSTNVNFTPFLSSSNLAGGCTADPGTSTVSASPPSVVANGTTTSTITVTLLDSVSNPVSGKTVTLAAGSGSSVISAASGPSDASGVVTFTVKDAVAETVTYTAHDTTDSVTLTSTAAVTFTVIPVADISITKTVVGAPPYAAGANRTYTITVFNNGGSAATGVTVSDTLPVGTAFVSATPSQGSCSGTTTVSCALGGLVSGGSATISLVLTTSSTPGVVSNTATVTAAQVDTNLNNNTSTSTITTIPASQIPAISGWALIALAALLVLLGAMKIRS